MAILLKCFVFFDTLGRHYFGTVSLQQQKPHQCDSGKRLLLVFSYEIIIILHNSGLTLISVSHVQGGESTRDEMCQALLLYYPKADIAHCGTFPDPNTVHRPFLNKYYLCVHTLV